jgi:hypothetical protein
VMSSRPPARTNIRITSFILIIVAVTRHQRIKDTR